MIRHLRWQIALGVAGALFIGVFLLLVQNRAFRDEPAQGGQFVEALVGQPRTFNPLFVQSDVEVDLARLVFSGLTRPRGDGSVEPDLAERWEVSQDGRTYTFTLRAGLVWHDRAPVTADDVVFTAGLAAAADIPDKQKTRLAEHWRRATATKVDAHTVRIALEEAYAPFLNATMLGLLPAHLLADVAPAELATSTFSAREPVGTGPYALARLEQPAGAEGYRIELHRFDGHWAARGGQPYLERLVFQCYPTLDKAVEAIGQHSAQGLGRVPAQALSRLGGETPVQIRAAVQAGYTLIYLNPSQPAFANHSVRLALSLALDRLGIIHDPALLDGQGVVATSPIPPGAWAYDPTVPPPVHDPEAARRTLDEAGWIDSDGDGVRDRDGQPLAFTLGVLADDALLTGVAERVRDDWSGLGVGVDVQPLAASELLDAMRNRTFAALVFSWELRDYDPDPYPLWHSSQVDFPGQNFAGFRNTEADRVLVEARQANPATESARRRGLFATFQQVFATELPALLIYHPVYSHVVTDVNVGGVQLPQLIVAPADRFQGLAAWFVQTRRVFGESASARP